MNPLLLTYTEDSLCLLHSYVVAAEWTRRWVRTLSPGADATDVERMSTAKDFFIVASDRIQTYWACGNPKTEAHLGIAQRPNSKLKSRNYDDSADPGLEFYW